MTNQAVTFEVLAKVAQRAEAEGRADYLDRADDVARGGEDPEWAWPFNGADDAYLNAVSCTEICRKLGLSESAWEQISETWLNAFRAGYVAAHDEG